MEVSVSLPPEDVEFLDAYAHAGGFSSRSAVVHKAVRLLRGAELSAAYEEAFSEWEESGLERDWEVAVADGITPDAAR